MEHLGSSDSSSPQVSQNHTHCPMSRTLKCRTDIGFDFVLSPGHRGFYISKTEASDSSGLLSSDSCSEFIITDKLLILPIVYDALKIQETKQSEALPKDKLVGLNKKGQSLAVGSTKLKHKIEKKESDMRSQQNDSKVQSAGLQTEKVAERNGVISDSHPKFKTTEEELNTSNELYMELVEKFNAFADMDKKLEDLTLKKDAVNAKLNALWTEKCSRDSLIREEIVNLNKDLQSIVDENRTLKHEIQENGSNSITENADLEMERLMNQVADFKRIIISLNEKVKSGEAVIASYEQLIPLLYAEIDSQREMINGILERATIVVLARDDRITELNTKNNEYMSEIRLLNTELQEICKFVDDLKKSLNALKLREM